MPPRVHHTLPPIVHAAHRGAKPSCTSFPTARIAARWMNRQSFDAIRTRKWAIRFPGTMAAGDIVKSCPQCNWETKGFHRPQMFELWPPDAGSSSPLGFCLHAANHSPRECRRSDNKSNEWKVRAVPHGPWIGLCEGMDVTCDGCRGEDSRHSAGNLGGGRSQPRLSIKPTIEQAESTG